MLDVRRLRVLREVALRGSFSAAAEALTYSQSAVSQQIAALEPEAGARLVERNGRADLVLVARPVGEPPTDQVEAHRLLEDPMLAVLPGGHRLARRRTLRLDDLAAEPWVLGGGPGCSDRATILRACHAAGFEPRVTVDFPTDDYNATQGMVAAGAGVTL